MCEVSGSRTRLPLTSVTSLSYWPWERRWKINFFTRFTAALTHVCQAWSSQEASRSWNFSRCEACHSHQLDVLASIRGMLGWPQACDQWNRLQKPRTNIPQMCHWSLRCLLSMHCLQPFRKWESAWPDWIYTPHDHPVSISMHQLRNLNKEYVHRPYLALCIKTSIIQ